MLLLSRVGGQQSFALSFLRQSDQTGHRPWSFALGSDPIRRRPRWPLGWPVPPAAGLLLLGAAQGGQRTVCSAEPAQLHRRVVSLPWRQPSRVTCADLVAAAVALLAYPILSIHYPTYARLLFSSHLPHFYFFFAMSGRDQDQ